MRDLIEKFERDEFGRLRPATRRSYRSLIKSAILPPMGDLQVQSVTVADVERLHRRISARAPYAANRAVALLGRLFRLAGKWGWCEGNPAPLIERNSEPPRHRYLTGAELSRFLAALDNLGDRQAATIFRFLLLTGCRKSEICRATWDQFDLVAGVWAKPASAVRQKVEHRVPLSGAAVELLQNPPGAAQSPFVFSSTRKGGVPRTELRGAWREVCRAAEISDLRVHDLRHAFASLLVQSGASLPVIGGLLGHRHPVTTARYSEFFNSFHAAKIHCSPSACGLLRKQTRVPLACIPTWLAFPPKRGYIPGYGVRDTLRLHHAPPRRACGHRRL